MNEKNDDVAIPTWTFKAENLGYIANGELSLKPLTILCGPNNTGKTWMMYLIYGILRHIPTDKPLPSITDLTEKLLLERYVEWNIIEWIDENFHALTQYINSSAQQRLSTILNADPESFEKTKISFDFGDVTTVKERAYIQAKGSFSVGSTIFEKFSLEKEGNSDIVRIKIPDKEKFKAEEIESTIKAFILGLVIQKKMGQNPVLLPSERNGLHLLFRELNIRRTALLSLWRGNTEESADFMANISRYAEPIADYINWLNHLGINRKSGSYKTSKEELKLLEKVINGSFEIDKENNIGFMQEGQQSLDLHLTSSTVNSLAGLWFYIKNSAREGHFLMIDEPELNLHPTNQRALAHLLARLVNKGIRIVISTHSDYLINELSTLIMLSQHHPKHTELMQKYSYDETELLQPDQVGAYLFADKSIKLMEVDPAEGIIATTFDEVIRDLNETNEDIYYTLRDWQDTKG